MNVLVEKFRNTSMIRIIIVLALACMGLFAICPNWFQAQTALGLILVSTFIAYDVFKMANAPAALLFLYSISSAIWFGFWPITRFVEFEHNIAINMAIGGSQSALFTLAVITLTLYIVKQSEDWFYGFAILALVSSLFCVFNLYQTGLPAGILNNCSMDSMFFALVLPFVIQRKLYYFLPFILGGLALDFAYWHSVTGPFMLIAYAVLWSLFNKKWGVLSFLFLGGVVLAAIKLNSYDKFLRLINGRQTAAYYSWETAKQFRHYFEGMGSASFISLMPTVQTLNNDNELFYWAHNEYIQVAFEQGVAGLSLGLAVFYSMLKRSFNEPWLFMTVIGMIICSMSQMPLRLFPTAMFFALVCRKCFEVQRCPIR